MPAYQDFSMGLSEDVTLLVSLTDAQPVSGWQVEFTGAKRFGGSGWVNKSIALASGIMSGASGVAVTDSGRGQFLVSLYAKDVSGLNPSNMSFKFRRLCSGRHADLTVGYVLLRL